MVRHRLINVDKRCVVCDYMLSMIIQLVCKQMKCKLCEINDKHQAIHHYVNQTYTFTYIHTGGVKKVWFAAPGAKMYLFCATLMYVVFHYFLKICNYFFGTPVQWPKRKSANLFFLRKSKVQKSKNLYRNYFYRNLKSFNDWIKESQKIRKIVIRNSQILVLV